MREIKFRGRRVDNGEWVEGFYIYDDRPLTGHYIINYKGYTENIFEVLLKTVGQFTGLKDKNGKEIYDGDVMQGASSGDKYKVIFSEGCFQVSNLTNPSANLSVISNGGRCFEIIGNIYENPELIERKKYNEETKKDTNY